MSVLADEPMEPEVRLSIEEGMPNVNEFDPLWQQLGEDAIVESDNILLLEDDTDLSEGWIGSCDAPREECGQSGPMAKNKRRFAI